MKYTVNITVNPTDEKNEVLIKKLALIEILKSDKNLSFSDISKMVFVKKSIDARHGQVKFHLRYDVYTGKADEINAEMEQSGFSPKWKNADPKKRVLIIGSGPAGLFSAFSLLEKGITPVIVERGPETSQRKIDIADISRLGKINENSNYCFGEGGAGTFSDGKLYSRSNKRGNISNVLQLFNYFGADSSILTDAHPHIGTDKLPKIIESMISEIQKLGGEVFFNTLFLDLLVEPKSNSEKKVCKGISVLDLKTSEKREILGDSVILACGHSSPEVYEKLYSIAPNSVEAKSFAVGVRLEHPLTVIDKIQYHGKERGETLPAAEYRLTTQVQERGVYSFCMCPGGFVVPSSSSPDGIVVNGMSSSDRNSAWSNAAIVVEIRPEDICDNHSVLEMLKFRTNIEQTAKSEAQKELSKINEASEVVEKNNPQTAPAQRLEDFLNGKNSRTLPKSSYIPGLVPSRLDKWLPAFIVNRLKQAFFDYDRNMHGLICEEAVLIAPETRTSTPVRILRDKETFENPVIEGLFPAGEGSGYAGGIVSSAMDGQNVATVISKKYV